MPDSESNGERGFEARKYVARYYPSWNGCEEWVRFTSWNLKGYLHDLKGHRLLDVGCGPCVNVAVPASENFDQIVLSDFLQSNLDEVQRWLNGDPQAIDWSDMLNFYAENGQNIDELATRVRSKVTQLLRCDVNNEHVLERPCGLFDVVVSSMCCEVAVHRKTINEFSQAVGRLRKLIKADGHLILVTATEQSYFSFTDCKGDSVSMKEHEVVQAVETTGLELVKKAYLSTPSDPAQVGDDARGMLVSLWHNAAV